MSRRPGTADDRDTYRPKTPPTGHPAAMLAIPDEVPEDITGMYSGAERQERRERRSTPERLTRLEVFKDDMLDRMPRVETKLDTLVRMAEEDRADRRAGLGLEKTRISSRAKVIVAIVGAVTAIITAVTTLAATGKIG